MTCVYQGKRTIPRWQYQIVFIQQTFTIRWVLLCIVLITGLVLRFSPEPPEMTEISTSKYRLKEWIRHRNLTMAADGNIPCIGKLPEYENVEDLFCEDKPKYLSNYKSQCWFGTDILDGQEHLFCLPYYHILGVEGSGISDLLKRITLHGNSSPVCHQSLYWSQKRYGAFGDNPVSGVCNFRCYQQYFFDTLKRTMKSVLNTNIFPTTIGEVTQAAFYDFRFWDRIPQNHGLKEPIVLTPHIMKHIYKVHKFIIVFRHPVERLYSHYIRLNRKFSALVFHIQVTKSIKLIEDCLRNYSHRRCFFNRELVDQLPVQLHVGCYSVFLKEWLNVFKPEDFLILRTEDYSTDINIDMKEVFDFLSLGYDESLLIKISQHTRSAVTNLLTEPMWNITRDVLNSFYKHYSEDLASLLQDNRFRWSDQP